MATRTVAHLYDNYEDAAQTVRDLEASGISHDDISVVASNADKRHQTAVREPGNESVPGAEIGGGLGAVAGGGAGVLAGLGMLAIPGVGPVVAAGWLVALVVGAAGGAAVGGLAGGLIGSGISKEHAEVYAEGVRRGGTVVSVRVPEDRVSTVESIMARNRSVDIDARRSAYTNAGWAGYDPMAPAYTADEVARERASYPR